MNRLSQHRRIQRFSSGTPLTCRLALVLAVTAAAWLASAIAANTHSLNDDLKRVTDILNPIGDSSATLEVTERNGDRLSSSSSYQAVFHGQDLMLLRKTAPAKDAGRTILLQQNRMWVELSAARKPLQLPLEQRWNSDAAYADLARANFSRDYRVERVEADGAPRTQHLFLRALSDDVPYAAVELWVDKQTGYPRRALFTTSSKALARDCTYSSYRNVLGRIRPTQLSFSDPGRPGWQAELVFRNWTPAKADSRLFQYSALGKEESVVTEPKRVRERVQERVPEGVRAALPERDSPDEMVPVPAGSFVMGRDNGFPDEEPAHEISLAAFWIDRTEVTVKQYRKFLRAKSEALPASPASPSMPKDYFVNPSYSNFPMVSISWFKANEYCRWMSKRLPTEAEWEKAARGTDRRLYPWGNVWDEDLANSRESAVSSMSDKLVHFTNEVASVPRNASPYGAFDMAGNAWEWVADWYEPYPESHDQSPYYGKKYKVIRGGSWVSGALSLATVARDFSDPAAGFDSIGFRCAR